MVCNDRGELLMAKVERGHFRGFWTLPGGYMDHDEHPSKGCVREALEEMGIVVATGDDAPVFSQRIFLNTHVPYLHAFHLNFWTTSMHLLEKRNPYRDH